MKRLNVSDLIDQTPIKHSIRETDTEYVEEVADGEFALDVERIVADVLNSGARVAPDLRIDDRDLKEFPNFYEWCFSKDGGNQAPFAKQLALATHLMAEWCPRCSHKAFRNIHKIPVNFPAKDFPDKVQFLYHGVCPKCGARKSELVKSGELNAYVELDVCAGQRCITGDSLVLTSTGYKRIKDLLPNADYGYTDKLSLVHNGKELTYMTKFFRAKAEPLYKVTLRSGLTIIGTKDHPVKTNEGFIKLPDLLGKCVETPIGTNIYGSNVLSNEQLVEYLDYDYIPDCILQATKDVQLTFLRMIGVEIGKVFRIRNPKMLGDVALLLRNMGYETTVRSTTMKVSETVYKQTYKYDRCVFVDPYAEEETFDIRVPNGSTFIANGILNHNSGKSAFFNLLVPYLTHKWVKVEKPVETLGLMSSSILIGTCTALTWAKAQELLYDPISNAIENSKWFQQYFQLLDDYEERTGIELYKFKDTFLSFNHKNLILNTSGPNKRTLRGATRWMCIAEGERVNTQRGLIPIENVSIGDTVYRGSSSRVVTNKVFTGKKDTVKLTTSNGLTLRLTNDHKVLVLKNGIRTWVKAEDSLGLPIAVTLGSYKNVEPYQFNFVKPSQSNRQELAIQYMIDNPTFQLTDIENFLGSQFPGLTAITSKLRKANLLDRKRGLGNYMTYWLLNRDKHTLLQASGTLRESKQKQNRLSCTIPTKSSYKLGYIIGALIADGSYNSDVEFSYNTSSQDKLELFLKFFEQLFNVRPNYSNYYLESGTKMYKVHIGVKPIKEFFRHIGLAPAVADTKSIPQFLFESDIKTIRGLLKGLLLHDGMLKHNYICYSTKSEALANDVLSLLICLGFHTNLVYQDGIHYVEIRNSKDFLKWSKLTASFDKQKKTTVFNSIKDRKPNYSREYLLDIIPDLFHWSGKYSMFNRPDLITNDSAEYVQYLAKDDLRWLKVTNIEPSSNSNVYDIEVDHKDHTFSVNNICVHNCIIDEIGWFPHGDDNDERERASANEVYVSLDRSLKTVRKSTMKLLKEGYDNIPLAYGCGISSPSSYNDKIMELVRNFKGSKEVLVHQAPTWEMNPLFTKDDFAKEYQDDPIKAERDFGANPPMAENAWISDVKSLDHLLVNRWVIDYQYDHFTNRSGVDMVFGKLRSTKAPPTCPPTVLTIDAGYSNNSFALAITANDGRGANVLAVAEIAPKKGITVINYTRTVKQLLYPLIKAFNVQAVGADRWNSLKLLQDIEEDCHVQTFQYSLKPTDFDLVYDYLMEDLPAIKLPRPEMDLGQIFVTSDYPHGFKYKPNSHLYHQFSTVNVDGRGSVEKGNGYTDDILRAVALGIRTCVLEDTIKKFNLRGATKQTKYAIGARSGSAQATSSSTIGSKTGSSGGGSFGSRG